MTKQPMHVTEGNFGGKIANFSNAEERVQEQKHLKAYLAGYEYYRNGYKMVGNENHKIKVTNWLPVSRLEVENTK